MKRKTEKFYLDYLECSKKIDWFQYLTTSTITTVGITIYEMYRNQTAKLNNLIFYEKENLIILKNGKIIFRISRMFEKFDWFQYLTTSTITTVETTNYDISNIQFPGVTVCSNSRSNSASFLVVQTLLVLLMMYISSSPNVFWMLTIFFTEIAYEGCFSA